MTVYVDLLFGLNMTLNYLLLRGSAAMSGCPSKLWRRLSAAAVGGLYAVAAVLPGMEMLSAFPFQLFAASLMVLVAFGWKKNTVKQGLFFFALSFAFGGAVLLLIQAVEPDCMFLDGHAYYAVSTPALLFLAGVSYGFAALVLRGWGAHTGGDIVPITLELNAVTIETKALRDTGNTLRDPVSGQHILVASWAVLSRLIPEAGLVRQDFDDPVGLLDQLGRVCPRRRFRLVPYKAVGVQNGMLPAVRCFVLQGKRREEQIVAFTSTELSSDGQFEILTGGNVS